MKENILKFIIVLLIYPIIATILGLILILLYPTLLGLCILNPELININLNFSFIND